MTVTADVLVDQLRAARLEFERPAVPAVYAEYAAFMRTGRYPYLADVDAFIRDRHDIPGDLGKQLDREVYLASGQHSLAEMVAAEEAGHADGYMPITDVEPAEGLILEIRGRDHGPLRMKPTGSAASPWALLPKGRRTHGYDFARYVEQHRAYLRAKERGQVAMDGPRVVMVRVVTPGKA